MDVEKERELFELDFIRTHYHSQYLLVRAGGLRDYYYDHVENRWLGWLAAKRDAESSAKLGKEG
jgi:hypothetical protein